MRHKSSGFTLVEMLIVAPIVLLVIGAFLLTAIQMVGDSAATRRTNTLTLDLQDALNRIELDVKMSPKFLATNSITPLQTGQGVDDATAGFNNANATFPAIILNSYATTANPTTDPSGRSLIYLGSAMFPCGSINVAQSGYLMTNVVYFVKTTNGVTSLWRRVLTSTTTGCSTPWQKPSCTPGYVAAFCKANDQELVDGITSFSVVYYGNPSTIVALTSASDPAQAAGTRQTMLNACNTAIVTIGAQLSISGRNVTQSLSLKVVGPNMQHA